MSSAPRFAGLRTPLIMFTTDSWWAIINAIEIVAAGSVEVLPRNPALDAQQFLQACGDQSLLGVTGEW